MDPGDVTFSSYRCSPFEDGSPEKVTAAQRARGILPLALAILACVLAAVPAPAKQKGPVSKTVSGVVTDDAENFIQGAMIELKDLQSGKVLDIYSQANGQYQFTDLRFDHDYTVQATYHDISSEVRQVSSIDTRARLTLNLVISKTK